MNNSYVIINDNQENVLKIQTLCDEFQSLHFVASANNYADGVNAILEFLRGFLIYSKPMETSYSFQKAPTISTEWNLLAKKWAI